MKRRLKSEYQHVDGQRLLQVSLRHPVIGENWRDLLFDDSYRLIERQSRREKDLGGRMRVYERWKYGPYAAHQDASGETIWFPKKAVVHLYMGTLPDGTLVEYTRETLTVKDIKFNQDIPQERFTLDLPKDAEIRDEVTGQGFLPAGADFAAWTNPPMPSRQRTVWMWIGIVVGCIMLMTLLGWFWFRRRKAVGA